MFTNLVKQVLHIKLIKLLYCLTVYFLGIINVLFIISKIYLLIDRIKQYICVRYTVYLHLINHFNVFLNSTFFLQMYRYIFFVCFWIFPPSANGFECCLISIKIYTYSEIEKTHARRPIVEPRFCACTSGWPNQSWVPSSKFLELQLYIFRHNSHINNLQSTILLS